MTHGPELPGMPAPTTAKPRKGSRAWIKSEWDKFRTLAAEHEGLTQPVMAAVALGITRGRVHQLIDEGRLEAFEIMGRKFLSCREIAEFAKLERDCGFRYESSAA